MARVLVTGGGGFIGRHLVRRLIEGGASVRVLLRTAQLMPTQIEAITGDVRDRDAMRAALDGMDLVYHLAAQSSGGTSIHNPAETFAINALGTLNVLEAASAGTRVIVVSTSDVYGTPQSSPIDERHPLQPRTPYAASKVAAEALAISFCHSRGVAASVIRLFNTYGPGQDTRALVPTIIQQGLTQPFIELGSLTPVRDWLYVGDAVSGLLAAANGPPGEITHLGTGQARSVRELAQKTLDLLDKPIPIRSRTERQRATESDGLRLCADISKAKTFLGWQPEVSLDEGLRLTIEDFKRWAEP